MGAESLRLSNGTTSIPSSIFLIRHVPESTMESLSRDLTRGNAVCMLGSGWMFLTVLRGKYMMVLLEVDINVDERETCTGPASFRDMNG